MSEDRILLIFAENRSLPMDEDRGLEIWPEPRVLEIQDDERALEVRLP